MSGSVEIRIHGKSANVPAGIGVVEAASRAGLTFHDECFVELVEGTLDVVGSHEDNVVLARNARVNGAAELRFEPRPREVKVSGILADLRDLSAGVVEIVIRTNQPIPYLPGQYMAVEFAGHPARMLAPTLTLDGLRELDQLVFHMRRHRDGAVSSALGQAIKPGRKVTLRGPYGHAFLRKGEGRLVLVSSTTGFAPLWSIAIAARLGQPHRPLHVIASARDPRDLYMRPALEWLAKHGVEDITLAASAAAPMPPARHGRALAFLPRLGPADTIHAFGAAAMVDQLRQIAAQTGARCYANAFSPADANPSASGIRRFFTSAPKPASPVHAQIEALAARLSRPGG